MPYETKEELLQLGVIDPELDALLKEHPPEEPDYNDIVAFKTAAEGRGPILLRMLGPAPPGVKITESSYTTRDGHVNRAKVFQPSDPPSEGSALVVLIHGGGFAVGQPESEELTARNLVRSLGVVAVSIAYRLAPEYPFPYAVNDCWDGLKHFASIATDLGAKPSVGFIVGGTSAGGNLSAVLAHKARDEPLNPPLTGQWLSIPAVCPPSKLPEKYKKYSYSYEQNKFAPVLPQALIDLFMDHYKPDPDDAENYAALNHPRGHNGLPPAFFQIDGLDPLRDEALIYERVLREEAGVKTKLVVYPGLPHGHWAFFPTLKASKQFRADQIEGFGWLLGKKPTILEDELNSGASTA